MKKGFTRAIAPIMAALLIGAATTAAASTIKLVTGDYPPYTLQTPANSRHGFDHEVTLAAMKAAGQKVTIAYMPWKRAFKMLETGGADGVVTCSDVKERYSYMILSDPISTSGVSLVTSSSYLGEPISAAEQLPQLDSLVAIRGFATQQELTRLSIPHEPTSSVLNSLRMVARGRVQGFFIGLENSQYIASTDGIADQLRFHVMRDRPVHYFHVCFSKHSEDPEGLRDTFNRGLQKIRASGEYQRIHARYK